MTNNKHSKHTNQIRIINGQRRRRELAFLSADGLCLTPDSACEKLFNQLGQDLTSRTVLDLFSGNDALGMEAVSRHTVRVVMVDNHRQTMQTLQKNVRELGLGQMEIVCSDGMIYLTRPSEKFDVVLLDPSFAREDWRSLFIRLQSHLKNGAVVYIEAGKIPEEPDWLEIYREGKAGMGKFELLLYSQVAEQYRV